MSDLLRSINLLRLVWALVCSVLRFSLFLLYIDR